MADGVKIKDVNNILSNINDTAKIPVSSGTETEPQVVTAGGLKGYINTGMQAEIDDLSTIRSGAALGATAIQIESDPTVPNWAKEAQKPSYSYSEITGKPTLSTVATSGSYNDLTNKPDIPSEQIQSDWNQSNTSAKDYIKNKPEIPVLPTLADVATSGDYEDLTNTPTIPDVPEWAMSSTKPSYTVREISGAQEELVSGTNIKTINGTSVLGSGNITIQGGGGGDVNVIESITFNGSAVPVDSSKNAAITYSAPVISVNGNTGAVTISVPTKVSDLTNDSGFITSETEPDFNGSVAATITSADITAWNGKSTFSGSYDDLTDKPTLFSGAYADLTGKPNLATVAISGDYDDLSNKPTIPAAQVNSDWSASSGVAQILNKPTIPTVPTTLSSFTDDLGSSPTHTHSQYLTSHQDISGKEDTSNKVTSLSSSSTDTQYPSAKCVYDLVGDIETILSSI